MVSQPVWEVILSLKLVEYLLVQADIPWYNYCICLMQPIEKDFAFHKLHGKCLFEKIWCLNKAVCVFSWCKSRA